jgi:hypothetical protein
MCQNPSDAAFSPFCSKLCKNRDLLRWFKEDYRIPTSEPFTPEDETDLESRDTRYE